MKAARKVNDYATAVRILEGLKEKVENVGQYKAYLDELKPVIKELGEFLFLFGSCALVVVAVHFDVVLKQDADGDRMEDCNGVRGGGERC